MKEGPWGYADRYQNGDMLQAEGPGLDAVSYHFYGAVSQRCSAMGASFQTSPEVALTKEWLFATDAEAAFYGKLRDRYEPGKPLWLSETAEAACGGNPWAAGFIDSFRYLNQLGTLAKHGVKIVMHNTLTGSDYGLIDRDTLTPRPNYWAAILVAQVDGYHGARCRRNIRTKPVSIRTLSQRPLRWRSFAGHQCRPCCKTGAEDCISLQALHAKRSQSPRHRSEVERCRSEAGQRAVTCQ